MSKRTEVSAVRCIGLDIGDRMSFAIGVDSRENAHVESDVQSTPKGVKEFFSRFRMGTRVVCEAGTHSPWISSLLQSLKLDVVVVKPDSAGRAIAAHGKKNDRSDALILAVLGLRCVSLLGKVEHRSAEVRVDLSLLRLRQEAVDLRTAAINSVRGMVKSHGERLPAGVASKAFHRKVLPHVSEALALAIKPLLKAIEQLTACISEYDAKLKELCEKYPKTKKLQAIPGVGPLISLAFLLTVGDPKRFRRSRDVGAYLGLVPRQHESGDCSLQLRITKAGDSYLRALLVQGAHYILGVHGPDCELRQFGLRIASRGAAKGKKRAVIAVARKLAVVLHRLLASDEDYDPLPPQEP